jgi:uncharacterized membrane protein YedE/YeeE
MRIEGGRRLGETNKKHAVSEALEALYAKVFYTTWPAWLGGLLLGTISIATFAWLRPWGVVGGLREWIDWAFYEAGIYSSHPATVPLFSSSSILTCGLIWGALVSVLMSKRFAWKIPPPFEFARGALGGTFMGVGAAMAAGCNVGGFFSAASALSLGGLAMMAGLIVGVFLEVRYIIWEMQTFHFRRGDGAARKPAAGAFDWRTIQPSAGILLLATGIGAVHIYGAHGYSWAGGLLLCALAFGFVFHRSRFAFVKAFREPFVNGNADQSKGMALAVIVSAIGFTALKASGVRPDWIYVAPTFWMGSFIGGILFGFGMSFAGGCASGSCWRSAEGGVKQMVAFVFMGIANSFSAAALESSRPLAALMGKRIFLPDYISYGWSVALIVGVMLVYYLVMSWNEKSRAFV